MLTVCLIYMKLFLNTGTIYLMDGLQPQQEVDWCQTSSHPAAKLSLEKKIACLTRLRDCQIQPKSLHKLMTEQEY